MKLAILSFLAMVTPVPLIWAAQALAPDLVSDVTELAIMAYVLGAVGLLFEVGFKHERP